MKLSTSRELSFSIGAYLEGVRGGGRRQIRDLLIDVHKRGCCVAGHAVWKLRERKRTWVLMDSKHDPTGQVSTRIRFPPGSRSTETAPASKMAEQARKRTQRERLVSGMVEVTNRRGFAGAKVSPVIAEAGVSRPTFYDYFRDREDCLHGTIEDVQDEVVQHVEETVGEQPAEAALSAAAQGLVSYAAQEPARARFLMAEAMSGGATALDLRDAGIAAQAELIDARLADAPAGALVADLPSVIVIATVYRMLGTRLRRGEAAGPKLGEELLAWLSAYERRAKERNWGELEAGVVPGASKHVPELPIQQMPNVLPAGRVRLSEEEVVENRRLRILYAAARMAEQKGYTATTVADITRLARVDGRLFYRMFGDKQEAFSAVHEVGFQQVMDVTAKAFFAADSWPQRSWEAGRALTGLLARNPLVANVGFVEAYAVGPAAVQRIEDSHTAFLFFLQEGLTYGALEQPPSRVAMEAIIAGVFEIIYLQARRGEDSEVAAMLPLIAHIWLAPFLGSAEADRFIESQQKRDPKGTEKPGRKPRKT